MQRTFVIFGAVALCVVLAFALAGRTGTIDMKQKTELVPPGVVPHGGAERPIASTTGIGPGESKR